MYDYRRKILNPDVIVKQTLCEMHVQMMHTWPEKEEAFARTAYSSCTQ